MNGKHITALVVLLIIIFVAYNATFEVTPRDRVLVVQTGRIVGSDYKPGLHFKIPIIQTVHRFDRRVVTFTGDLERVLTSENKNLSVDYFVKWRVADPVKYYLATHGSADRAQELLRETVENDLLAEFSKRTVRQAIGDDRNEIVAAVQVQAGHAAEQLGVEIIDVRVMKLDLPEKVTEAIYERMRSARQEVILQLRAQGEAAAQEIRSDAKRARTVLLSDAYQQAQTIRGRGDAEAAEVYAKAYQKNPNFYAFYRSLQVYRQNIGEGDFLLLKPEGKLFKYFNPAVSEGAGQ